MTPPPLPSAESIAQTLRDSMCHEEFEAPDRLSAEEVHTALHALLRGILEYCGYETSSGTDLGLLCHARGETSATTRLADPDSFAGKHPLGVSEGGVLRHVFLCRHGWEEGEARAALDRLERMLFFGGVGGALGGGSLISATCLFLLPAQSQRDAFGPAEKVEGFLWRHHAAPSRPGRLVRPKHFLAGFRPARGDVLRVEGQSAIPAGYDVSTVIWRLHGIASHDMA